MKFSNLEVTKVILLLFALREMGFGGESLSDDSLGKGGARCEDMPTTEVAALKLTGFMLIL
jgi:hypothetical protein